MYDETALASQIAATLLAASPGSTGSDSYVQAAVKSAFRIIDVVREQQRQRQPAAEAADK
ncbi:MAG TPA: hypothetical protein VGH98_15200 [Gemmatimonadaceae bacterium]|jgi:hypothetical protein